jgi:BirA family biotin operon repressor/biotin-[acetyl-CoA-carboxylase] ligase
LVLSDHALARALERAGLDAPVRFDEVTRSTQESALRMAGDGAPEWTIVAAGHQTEGRGRLGRSWDDEPGRALMFSLVLRPDLPARLGGLVSLLAGTAMARACEELDGRRAECKWPNDVLVDGRKAGGILAESRLLGERLEHVALGIGVNLGSPPPAFPDAGAVDAGDEALLTAFVLAFSSAYRPAEAGFPRAVVTGYRERCATLGRRVRARTTAGAVVEGEAVDLDEGGGLIVRTAAGPEVVRFGAVEHLE